MPIRENGVAKQLDALLRARYSLIYLVSHEERRVETALATIARNRKLRLLTWSVSRGFVAADGTEVKPDLTDPVEALRFVANEKSRTLFVLKDFETFFEDVTVRRWVRDLATSLRACGTDDARSVVFLSTSYKLHASLEKDVVLLDWPLPTREQLGDKLDAVLREIDAPREKLAPNVGAIIESALGLTEIEAENAFALSIVERGKVDERAVQGAKKDAVRKSGVLEFVEPGRDLDAVGGLDVLKGWLSARRRAFSPEAKEFGLDTPKGVLLIGPPGTGKSLSAKAIAASWALPLVRLDVGKLLGSLVGESEGNLRSAIKVIESIAPAVLWVDEIEKALAGSGTDTSGVTTRLVGQLLTWMTEKTAPVYVVATANDVTALPPELTRKGRFDEIFVIDLPQAKEREQILALHLERRKRKAASFGLGQLASTTVNFSGAELEQVVIEALTVAFDAGREVTTDDLLACALDTLPLATTFRERIEGLRAWAKGRARFASSPEATGQEGERVRRIDLEDRN